MIDHDLQRDQTRQSHHLPLEIRGKMPAPPLQQQFADFVVQILRIEHQPVQIENDGLRASVLVHGVDHSGSR
jgi:hypothetical protein